MLDNFGPLDGIERGSSWEAMANLANMTNDSLNKRSPADMARMERVKMAEANAAADATVQGLASQVQDQQSMYGDASANGTPDYTIPPMLGGTSSMDTNMGNFVMDPSLVGRNPASADTIAISADAKKKMGKDIDAEVKQQEKEKSDYEKKVREYMAKREGIALDTDNRMAKLDSMYANQGEDYSGVMSLADKIQKYSDPSGRMGLKQGMSNGIAKEYAAGRMSEQQMMALKNKLAMQQDKQYGALTDDAANMYRMEVSQQQTKDNNAKAMKIAEMKAEKNGITLNGETKNKIGLINSATSGIDDMFRLLDSGKGDAAMSDFFLSSEYTVAKQTILDNFAHLQTGAAISTEESKLYKSLIPQYRDTKDVKLMKLRKMRDLLSSRHNMYTTGDMSMPVNPNKGYTPIGGGKVDYTSMNPAQLAEAYDVFKTKGGANAN